MKILILSDTTAWGGLESHAVALAESLVAGGHKPIIGCLGSRALELYRQMTPAGVQLVELIPPRQGSPWAWWRVFRGLDADAAVLEKGTLHTGGFFLDWVLKRKYARLITVQQLEPPSLPPRASRRYLGGLVPGLGLWWYRWKWSGYLRSLIPDATVCVSEAVRQRLIADYDFSAERTVTITNGVDPSKFLPNAEVRRTIRADWQVPEDAVVFGSVARLSPQKGLDIGIEAFAVLMRDRPSPAPYLVLVGDGPERPVLMAKAKELRLEGQALFPGFMAAPSAAYQSFDYFLIPSRFEGLPFSLVEAMASGCLVIGSNVGGIPEVITDASMGTLVPPEDPTALARAMSIALNRSAEERASEAHAARRRVAESFDIRVQCRKIVDMLEASRRGSRMTGSPQKGLSPSRETR